MRSGVILSLPFGSFSGLGEFPDMFALTQPQTQGQSPLKTSEVLYLCSSLLSSILPSELRLPWCPRLQLFLLSTGSPQGSTQLSLPSPQAGDSLQAVTWTNCRLTSSAPCFFVDNVNQGIAVLCWKCQMSPKLLCHMFYPVSQCFRRKVSVVLVTPSWSEAGLSNVSSFPSLSSITIPGTWLQECKTRKDHDVCQQEITQICLRFSMDGLWNSAQPLSGKLLP